MTFSRNPNKIIAMQQFKGKKMKLSKIIKNIFDVIFEVRQHQAMSHLAFHRPDLYKKIMQEKNFNHQDLRKIAIQNFFNKNV